VPAGQGKGRIAAAIAYYLLKMTKVDVYVVFADETLKNRDWSYIESLWQTTMSAEPRAERRLTYTTDFTSVKTAKNSVVIFDESDEIMFRDIGSF